MTNVFSKIEDIAKRRGFFWRSSEIYGGLGGFYDYGHLGKLVKQKWENMWRNFFLDEDNFYEIEPSVTMHEKVFIASGHVDSFADPIVKCRKCGNVERADQIMEEQLHENFEGLSVKELENIIKKHNIKCPKCSSVLEEVSQLNMLFPLDVGAENPQRAYMRGETAQGAYVNFRRAFEQLRRSLPMGLAIIGKAFRNEISPRNALLRMREFTQAELQIFFSPDSMNSYEIEKEYEIRALSVEGRASSDATEVSCGVLAQKLPAMYVHYMAKIQKFYLEKIGIKPEKFRFRELSEEERAFYNKIHWDMEILLDMGWKEVGGLHYRTDHDLKGHEKISNEKMSVMLDGKKFIPHVLELSFGVDRNIYALMELNYMEDGERSVLSFPPSLGPYHCAVFPLVSKDDLPEKAKETKEMLSDAGIAVFYDESGSIGRRYRRMDEIGVAICITIDHQTMNDDTVTIRFRDSMKQERIKTEDLAGFLINLVKKNDKL